MMGKGREEVSIVDLIEKNIMMEVFNLKGAKEQIRSNRDISTKRNISKSAK